MWVKSDRERFLAILINSLAITAGVFQGGSAKHPPKSQRFYDPNGLCVRLKFLHQVRDAGKIWKKVNERIFAKTNKILENEWKSIEWLRIIVFLKR